MKKNNGIIFFAFFAILTGLYGVLGLIIGASHHTPSHSVVTAVISGITSLCYVIFGYKLLHLRNWARIALLLLNAFFIVTPFLLFFYGMLKNSPENVWLIMQTNWQKHFHSVRAVVAFILSYAYFIGYIWFFTRPKIKEQFK